LAAVDLLDGFSADFGPAFLWDIRLPIYDELRHYLAFALQHQFFSCLEFEPFRLKDFVYEPPEFSDPGSTGNYDVIHESRVAQAMFVCQGVQPVVDRPQN